MKHLPLLTLLCCLLFTNNLFAQTKEATSPLTKKEAKKVAADINHSIEEMTKELEKLDWNALGEVLSKTIETIDKNAASLSEIVKQIDKQKLEKNLNDLSTKIEKSMDVKQLEQQIQRLGDRLQNEMPSKEKEEKDDF